MAEFREPTTAPIVDASDDVVGMVEHFAVVAYRSRVKTRRWLEIGGVYVLACSPDLWPLLHLPADHSSWARNVRWSCGRPGFEAAYGPISISTPRQHGHPKVIRQMRAEVFLSLAIQPPGPGIGPITAV